MPRGEGGNSLGEVVDADGQGCHDAHAHQTRVARAVVHLLDEVRLVGVLERGDQAVDQTDQQDAGEETRHGDHTAEARAPFGREGDLRLVEELDQRDVDHHSARESEREGEQAFVRTPGQKGDGASDSGGQTGAERQQQREEYLVTLHRCSGVGFDRCPAGRPLDGDGRRVAGVCSCPQR